MSFEEQIMSKDKYPSIFSPQMEAIVFIILQIFYATRTVLKIRRTEKDGDARGTLGKSTNRCKQCSPLAYRVTKCKLIFARKQCPLNASWGAVDINNGCTRLSNSIASQGTIKSNENGFLLSVCERKITSGMQAIAYVARIFTADTFTDPTISRPFSLERT